MKTKKQKTHRQKSSFWSDGKDPILIAHRGGDAAGYERRNTMAAFEAAWKMGYRYFETDVINTKDSRIIVSHGAYTGLTARLRGTHTLKILQSLTYEEIKQRLTVAGEEIILLEELLNKFPKAKFFVDPKTDNAVEPLAAAIQNTKAYDRVCVGSFYYKRVQRTYGLLGDKAQLALIIGRNLRLVYPNLRKLKRGQLEYVSAVYIHHSYVSKPMINLIHRHGLRVVVWTANSKLSIKNAIKCGTDGIMSDRVTLLSFAASGLNK
ncbi:hypothetical protein KW789_00715 [Candidatus Saccharibacteria bacterium]|nr:hypothetical protein [Candidatus Saccharibacteria bacterium]